MIYTEIKWKHKGVEHKGFIDNIYFQNGKQKICITFENGKWITGIPLMALYKNNAWVLGANKVPEQQRLSWEALMSDVPLVYMVCVGKGKDKKFFSVLAKNDCHAKSYLEKSMGLKVNQVLRSKAQIPEMHSNLIHAL